MHGGREICRRSDAGPFSNNPARADPRYQTNPTIEAQTFGLSLFSRLSAENQTILKISKRTRTPTETETINKLINFQNFGNSDKKEYRF